MRDAEALQRSADEKPLTADGAAVSALNSGAPSGADKELADWQYVVDELAFVQIKIDAAVNNTQKNELYQQRCAETLALIAQSLAEMQVAQQRLELTVDSVARSVVTPCRVKDNG